MVRKQSNSPVGDFQLVSVGKYLIISLMVFEQIAAVHLSARMKLGEMRKEIVWYSCLKYKEAGLGDLRQTSPIFLTRQIMQSITKLLQGYIPSQVGICFLCLTGWTWIFVRWPKAHVCTSKGKESIQPTVSCLVMDSNSCVLTPQKCLGMTEAGNVQKHCSSSHRLASVP